MFLGFTLISLTSFIYASNTILVLGDSLSAGYGVEKDQDWVSLLKKRLTELNDQTSVINASVSGDTSKTALSRLESLLREHTPTHVIVEIGANDGLQRLPLEEIHTNISTIVLKIKEAKCHVLLIGVRLPSNFAPSYRKYFENNFSKISKKLGVPLVDNILEGIDDKPEAFQEDNLHPNTASQPLILDTVWEKLNVMLSDKPNA